MQPILDEPPLGLSSVQWKISSVHIFLSFCAKNKSQLKQFILFVCVVFSTSWKTQHFCHREVNEMYGANLEAWFKKQVAWHHSRKTYCVTVFSKRNLRISWTAVDQPGRLYSAPTYCPWLWFCGWPFNVITGACRSRVLSQLSWITRGLFGRNC